MKSKLIMIAASAIFVMTSMPTFVHAKERLVVNCFWPPKHQVCNKLLPEWLAEVKKVTEGRVVGNIPPKSVAPPPEQLASVEKGVVDAAIQFNGLISNRVKGPLVAMQPFVGSYDAAAMSKALWETTQKYYPEEFKTVQLASMWVITPGQLFSMTDKPITTVEEFASRKIWALPGPIAGMSKALGAGVVSTPAVKSNEIISTGVVDGHLGLSGDAVKAFQVAPYTKSMTIFKDPIYSTSFSLMINKDKWAAISPEDQAAIMAISGPVFGAKAGAAWDSVGAAVYATFDDLGIAMVDADPAFEAALKNSAKPITAKWLSEAGPNSAQALEYYKKRVVELSK